MGTHVVVFVTHMIIWGVLKNVSGNLRMVPIYLYPPRIVTGKQFKKILPVRHPYDRVASMWKHTKKYGADHSWDDWFLHSSRWPCCFPVSRLYKASHFIRFENLVEDLKENGIEIDKDKFERLNHTDDIESPEITEEQKKDRDWETTWPS